MATITGAEFNNELAKTRATLADAHTRATGSSAALANASNAETALLTAIPKSGNGDFDPVQFNALPDAQKGMLLQQLRDFEADVSAIGVDGPLDPKSLMYKAYVSNRSIVIVSLYALLGMIGVVWGIAATWERALHGPPSATSSIVTQPSQASTKITNGTSPESATNQPTATQGASGTEKQAAQPPSSSSGTSAGSAAQTQSRLRVLPDSGTLQPGESMAFHVDFGNAQAQHVDWSAPTGVIAPDGIYTAPAAIAGRQQIKIAAKVASGEVEPSLITLTPVAGPEEETVLIMVMLMGALGAFLHLLSSMVFFVGNREFLRSWLLYYFLLPLEGVGLAIVTYLLLRVGVLNAGISNATGTGTAALNLIALYAFAGLTGLFAKQALQQLADVFSAIFKKVQAKDAGKSDSAASSH